MTVPVDIAWLERLGDVAVTVDGLVRVANYTPVGRPPEEVVMMEKARTYGAYAVFFEGGGPDRAGVAQAFVFVSDGPADDPEFAALHRRLWSWGGVPLAYRRTPGLVQLFRCAHKADFVGPDGRLICKPVETLRLGATIAAHEAWWDRERLRNGTLWDDPAACKLLLSSSKSAHRRLVEAVADLHKTLGATEALTPGLRRRLLILSLLIAYLDERGALPANFFAEFRPGATRFFEILANGPALLALLAALEQRFNGHVFTLDDEDKAALAESPNLNHFSRLIEAREEATGQLSLWALYSFRDLPVEVISHIYQLFVSDTDSSVYTPPTLVRLMLEEAMSWPRMDRLIARGEYVFDPSCGSGVFLVEAYKRLVLHWRSRHDWAKPGAADLRALLAQVRGVDLERGAIELAAFSLCLALCDALEPEEIRATVGLFPKLADNTLIASCFFAAKAEGRIAGPIGILVGNPPFESALKTPGARDSAARYEQEHGPLADKQVAYLFLHESMTLVAEDGVLCMLQQYNLLYNRGAAAVRAAFLARWDLREVLDFVSVRGLFSHGGADTKIVALLAEARRPPPDRRILHAVFRRGGRAHAEQRFDIDAYDLHWMSRHHVLDVRGPELWRANLLGGARVYHLLARLKALPTLREHADRQGWTYGEGFIEGAAGRSRPADHLTGQPLLPSDALTPAGVDRSRITIVEDKPIEGPRSEALFTPPMLLIREQLDLPHVVWTDGYLTFKNKIVGFSQASKADLEAVSDWLGEESIALRAYVAGISGRSLTQKSTTLAAADIFALPYPDDGDLDLSDNERIVAEDLIDHYREYVRVGHESPLAKADGLHALQAFNTVFVRQINATYGEKPILALPAQTWPGIICQPFVFGDGVAIDWEGADDLRGKLDALLHEQRGGALSVTRIARLYDGRCLFLLKPDRLRYWLRSTALRDSDDVLADLRTQGF